MLNLRHFYFQLSIKKLINCSFKRHILLSVLILCSSGMIMSEALILSQDSDGWTQFVPSSDSHIMYVSETGNDSTGVVYSSTDNADPFNPGVVNAFATYSAAFANTRDGYPDWILFKRGDVFNEFPGSDIRSGRGADEPFLIGSYGNTGAIPIIKSGTVCPIRITEESSSSPGISEYIAISGIEFYAHVRNPEDADFAGYGDSEHGIFITTAGVAGNKVRNVLIEGCTVSFYRNNLVVQNDAGDESITDIDIRRNTICNSYSVTSHSQGIYAAIVDNLLIEENIFDHNGWLRQSADNDRTDGGATFHNHNIYNIGIQNGVYKRNIISRASSIGTKLQGYDGIDGMVVDDNLYVDNEIGIDSCNNYQMYPYRVHNPVVSNNIFYELGLSDPTLRGAGWGMWIQGWDGGQIYNNLLIGHRGQMFFNLGEESRGIQIFDNIGMLTTMYGIYTNSGVALYDLEIFDNYFEKLNTESDRMIISDGASIAGLNFSGNSYFSSVELEFLINGVSYDPVGWNAAYEADADYSKRSFPEASRTIETYMESIGEEGTLDRFFEMCRSQNRYHWDARLLANNINTWLRAGYGIDYDSSTITASYVPPSSSEAIIIPEKKLSGLRLIFP